MSFEAEITVSKRSSGFRAAMERWNWLDGEKRRLEHQIARRRERIARWRADLDNAGQKAITYDKDRVQGGQPYTMEDYVADTLERIERTEREISMLQHQYDEICDQIQDIEDMVSMLRQEHQTVVRMYYRDRAPWHAIEAHTNYSRSRIYEILHELTSWVDGTLWSAERR
ncbi:hypothetical protein GCM10025857_34000 [Alicyclobacillus contaminans]|uniref:hypothetical protein n=1 Tax=Alicyclobacillus contaminans TaxID=392016 RepID=UPI000405C077|nr:hypothetical protein [Alicyclobacillus contaminans]GMA52043.1 hypothetical protein GCM10025857_34000 [Alicyclobacillus contaminans]